MPPTEPLIDTIGSYLTIQIGQIILGPVATAILTATFAAALLSAFYLWRIGKQEERLDRLVVLRGFFMGIPQDLKEALAMWEQGKLRVHIDSVLPLEKVRDAQARMAEAGQFGKIVLIP